MTADYSERRQNMWEVSLKLSFIMFNMQVPFGILKIYNTLGVIILRISSMPSKPIVNIFTLFDSLWFSGQQKTLKGAQLLGTCVRERSINIYIVAMESNDSLFVCIFTSTLKNTLMEIHFEFYLVSSAMERAPCFSHVKDSNQVSCTNLVKGISWDAFIFTLEQIIVLNKYST